MLVGGFSALLALPAAAQDDPAAFDRMFCSEVMQHANWINANIDVGLANGTPMMFDATAQFLDVRADCEGRAVAFRHFVDDTAPNYGSAPEAAREAAWMGYYCRQSVWREAIALGWRVTLTLSLADDTQYLITAECG